MLPQGWFPGQHISPLCKKVGSIISISGEGNLFAEFLHATGISSAHDRTAQLAPFHKLKLFGKEPPLNHHKVLDAQVDEAAAPLPHLFNSTLSNQLDYLGHFTPQASSQALNCCVSEFMKVFRLCRLGT